MSSIDRSATTLRVRADASNAQREITKLEKALERSTNKIKQYQATVAKPPQLNTAKTTRELNRFSNTAKNSFGALAAYNTFTSSLSGVLSGAFVFALANAGVNLFKLGAEAESTRERFLALSESIGIGRARYEELFDFASNRGLEFKGLAEATNQLRVVGFEGIALDEIIREVGIIAGSSTEKVQRITRALGQMRAFGRVALEELNQLTEAGVPIIQALAKQLEVAEGRVRGLISVGKIDFSDVRAAITDLAAEGSAFFIASEAQAATTEAEVNRLKNAYFLLADELNERTSPAFKGLIGGTTSVIEFLTTMEGAWISMSSVVLGVAIPAFGAILLHINRLSGVAPSAAVPRLARSLSNVNLRLQQVSVSSVGVVKGFRSIAVAARAAFTGPAAIITGLAIVGIPLLIEQLELARERFAILEEARRGPLPEINEEDGRRAFRRRERLINIERGNLDSNLQTYRNINGLIRSTLRVQEQLGEGGDILNDKVEGLNKRLAIARKSWTDQLRLVNNLAASTRQVGDILPTPPDLPDFLALLNADEEIAPWRIFLNTLELEYATTQDKLSKLQRAGSITRLQSLRQTEKELVDFLGELALFEDPGEFTGGFFFDDDGKFKEFGAATITRTREQLEALRLEIAALQAQQKETNIDPLKDVDKVLTSSARSIAELNANISVGAIEVGERQQELLDINRDTLSDLLVLLKEFRNEADPEVYGEAIDRIVSRLRGFRESINQSITEDVNFIDLLIPGANTFDPVTALEGLFSDAEREYFRRAKQYVRKIGSIKEFIVPASELFAVDPLLLRDRGLPRVDQILEQRKQTVENANDSLIPTVSKYNQTIAGISELEFGSSSNVGRVLRQQQDQIEDANDFLLPIAFEYNQTIGDIVDPDLREFGDSLGIHVFDQNEIIATALADRNDITEVESLRFLEFLDTQVDAVRDTSKRIEDLPDTFAGFFDVTLPPQVRAFANALLTTGEAAVSAGPALDNIFSIFEAGSGAFADDPAAGIIGFFNALATGVSLVEQPLLAFSDAVISSSEIYRGFLENIVSLTPEERDIFFESLPDFYEDRLRRIVADFQEVYARVGDEFDANLFRILPKAAQDNLEAAYQLFRGAKPILENLFSELNEVIEAENITVSERIRRTGQFVADNLINVAIEYGDTATSIFNALSALTTAGGDAIGLGREVVGNLGVFFDLERDRVSTFFDALVNGTDSVILVERITKSLDTSSIGAALNFLKLGRAIDDVDGATQELVADAFRMNAAFAGVEFRGSDLVGTVDQLNGALGKTELTMEDLGMAATSLALSGGSLTSLIAPGAGLLAGAVNDVIDSTAKYVTAVRLANQIPAFIRGADVETLQLYATELLTFDERFAKTVELRRELDSISTVPLPPDFFNSIEKYKQSLDSLDGAGISIPFPQLSEGAREFQQTLAAVSPAIIALRSELGEAFLTSQGFFPDEPGGSIVDSLIASGQFQVLADQYVELRKTILDGNKIIFDSFLATFNGLGDLIANHASEAIKELEFALTDLREKRQEGELVVKEQLSRETEGLKEELNAGLISLLDYYSEVDKAREVAKEEVDLLRVAEVKAANDVQEKRWQAENNSFNIRKASSIASILVAGAQAFSTTLGLLGPFGIPVAPVVAALAVAQAALVFAQKGPTRPPEITLQEGGIVTSPTNALIGEAGPEAVIPLDEYTFNKRGEGTVTVIVNVYGSIIEERRVAESVYKATKEAQRVRRIPSGRR